VENPCTIPDQMTAFIGLKPSKVGTTASKLNTLIVI